MSSKGQFGIPECSYVAPHSGGMHYEFQIYYDRCGTKPDMGGKFYENTIIIQYDADLIEVSVYSMLFPVFSIIFRFKYFIDIAQRFFWNML